MVIQSQTLSQQIADTIARKISSGELKPGERLLENDFKLEFQTSRAPIREALLILEQKGIVERKARKGVYVKSFSKSEMLDFYKVVYDLTNYAITYSKGKKNSEIIKNAKKELNILEQKVKESDLIESYHIIEKLHKAIFDLSHNRTLIDIYLTVNTQWTTFRYLTLSHPSSLKESCREYKEIFVYIEHNKQDEALRVLKEKEKRALNIVRNLSTDEF